MSDIQPSVCSGGPDGTAPALDVVQPLELPLPDAPEIHPGVGGGVAEDPRRKAPEEGLNRHNAIALQNTLREIGWNYMHIGLEGFPIYLNTLPSKEWLESIKLQLDVAKFLEGERYTVVHNVLLDDYSVDQVHPEAAAAYLKPYDDAGVIYTPMFESAIVKTATVHLGEKFLRKDGKVQCAALDAVYQRYFKVPRAVILLHPKSFVKQQEEMHTIFKTLPNESVISSFSLNGRIILTQFVTNMFRFSKTLVSRIY